MEHALLRPTLTLVALTFAVWIWMYIVRLRAIARNGINPQALDTRDAIRNVMGRANLPADNLSNLLEMPVLFYALVAVLLATGLADPRFTQLA